MKALTIALISSLFVGHCMGDPAFYNQREHLALEDTNLEDITQFELTPYFESKPLVFGLISNKTRSVNRGGFLCHA